MANDEHLAILKRGVEVWNKWRTDNPTIIPDLTEALLTQADLSNYHLSNADLQKAYLDGAKLDDALLIEANLTEANLFKADLAETDLSRVIATKARFTSANLFKTKFIDSILNEADFSNAVVVGADFTNAKLSESVFFLVNAANSIFKNANLQNSSLAIGNFVEADLSEANLSGCKVYGISIWNTKLENAIQSNLTITHPKETPITVDNLKVAQFVHLLLNNTEIRDVIDTITGRAALILGRFTDDRKVVLESIRDALREHGYLPILFDFERPTSRDLTETILTLASISRFIIADLTDAKSLPQELKTVVPNLPSVAVQPIILEAQREYAMYEHIARFPSVLPIHEYKSQDSLILELFEKVIAPAERKANEQRPKPL